MTPGEKSEDSHFNLYNSVVSSGPLLKHASLSSTANIEDSEAPILTIKQHCLSFQLRKFNISRIIFPRYFSIAYLSSA